MDGHRHMKDYQTRSWEGILLDVSVTTEFKKKTKNLLYPKDISHTIMHSQSITILKMHENVQSLITPTKSVKSKWRDNMINYTSWLIILPNMKAVGPTTSEELHSQNERMNEQTNEHNGKMFIDSSDIMKK